MEIRAVSKNVHMTARKLRMVADFIRGQTITEARKKLMMLTKSGSSPVSKALESAVSNAVNNFKLNLDGLTLQNILIDDGKLYMRKYDRAHSYRYSRGMIRKKGAHVTVILTTKEEKHGK